MSVPVAITDKAKVLAFVEAVYSGGDAKAELGFHFFSDGSLQLTLKGKVTKAWRDAFESNKSNAALRRTLKSGRPAAPQGDTPCP